MDDEQRSQDDAHPTDAQAIDAAPIDTSDAVDALDSAQVANVADADPEVWEETLRVNLVGTMLALMTTASHRVR